MISGHIKIENGVITSELYKHGKLITSEFEKVLILRDLINMTVNDWERNVQIGYLKEVENLPPHEEKF